MEYDRKDRQLALLPKQGVYATTGTFTEILNTKEAATYLGLSYSTLCRWRMTGEGPPFVRAGARRIIYRKTDLDNWLLQSLVRSTSEKMNFIFQNNQYDDDLLDVVTNFRQNKKRPKTDLNIINKIATKELGPFAVLPYKALQVLRNSDLYSKVLLLELINQHIEHNGTQNGLLVLSLDKLANLCKCSKDKIIQGIYELSELGLLRLCRAVRNSRHTNAYLITFLPDCLGNAAKKDYEDTGIIQEMPKNNISFNERYQKILKTKDKVRKQLEKKIGCRKTKRKTVLKKL